MRRLACTLLVTSTLFAACSGTTYHYLPQDGGTNNGNCGGAGQVCCANNACTVAGASCIGGLCLPPGSCGFTNGPCCTKTGVAACSVPGTGCQAGVCTPHVTCGGLGAPCCANNTCTATNAQCLVGVCAPVTTSCGTNGLPCCTGNSCTDGSTCTSGVCVKGVGSCGTNGLPCCTGNSCTDGSACTSGVCVKTVPSCGVIGQPCCSGGICGTGTCVSNVCTATACGASGEPCCSGNVCTDGASMCSGGVCVPMVACGQLDQACCGGTVCTDTTLVCMSGICVSPPPPCGGLDQTCCNGVTCNSGLQCSGGTCVTAPACGALNQQCCNGVCNTGLQCTNNSCVTMTTGTAITGAACTASTQCMAGTGGQAANCVTSTGTSPMVAWPMGYCTSACNQSNTNTTTGINTDCPGNNATCQDPATAGGMGSCVTACTKSSDCRTGYSCFVVGTVGVVTLGCLPTAISQCDPRVKGSCPMANGMAQTCVNVGDGTVGVCVPSCNPFTNTGCAAGSGCYASDQTGEGLCVQAGANGVAGATCGSFYNDCAGGYGCYRPNTGQNGKCYKYCNTSDVATQCTSGAMCAQLDPTSPVATTVAGVCTMSN